MNIFLIILISLVLGFIGLLLILCGYQLYSYIEDDIEKRKRKKERYGK